MGDLAVRKKLLWSGVKKIASNAGRPVIWLRKRAFKDLIGKYVLVEIYEIELGEDAKRVLREIGVVEGEEVDGR